MASFCAPSLPLAVSRPAAIVTSTPLGIPTGFLPTRDILEHPAEDFAADILGARLGIGHDAARRRQDGDAEPVVDARQILDLGIDAAAGGRDAGDLLDHRLALGILQLDRQLGHAGPQLGPAVAADIALALQHLENLRPEGRGRAYDRGLALPLAIADAGEHIAQGIAHRHTCGPPTSSP